MTGLEWECSADAKQMLAAACDRVTKEALWKLVSVLGRAFCARTHYTLALATEAAEQIASGAGDPVALNNRWYAAFGTGMYLEDAGDAAEEMLEAAHQHLEPQELADILRQTLGNPL